MKKAVFCIAQNISQAEIIVGRLQAAGFSNDQRGMLWQSDGAGGGALLMRLDQLITKETGVVAYVAEAPMAYVAMGAGKALENYSIIRRSISG